MKRCIDSGLWVPNSKMDESDEKEDEGAYAEVKQEQGDANKEWPNRNVISSVFNYSRILWSLDSTAFAGFFHLYLQCVWNTAHVLNLCHITAVHRHKLQGKKKMLPYLILLQQIISGCTMSMPQKKYFIYCFKTLDCCYLCFEDAVSKLPVLLALSPILKLN